MKKLVAIFLALTAIPNFHAHAWVGGPFDNNNHSPNGDDGIYEAVATTQNGVGLYRWGVGNRAGATNFNDGRTGNTGNVQFGGFAGTTNQHVWYFEGNVYYGTCFGTVNSAAGAVECIGNAATLVPVATSTGVLAGPGGAILTPGVTYQVVTPIGQPPEVVTIPTAGIFCNSNFSADMSLGSGRNGFGRHNPAAKDFSGQGIVFVGTTPTGSLINNTSTGAGTQRTFLVYGNRVSSLRNG